MIGANTLTANQFTYELDFSNRDNIPSPGAEFAAQLGFDTRTDGNFTTAQAGAPEPGTFALLGLALGGVFAR